VALVGCGGGGARRSDAGDAARANDGDDAEAADASPAMDEGTPRDVNVQDAALDVNSGDPIRAEELEGSWYSLDVVAPDGGFSDVHNRLRFDGEKYYLLQNTRNTHCVEVGTFTVVGSSLRFTISHVQGFGPCVEGIERVEVLARTEKGFNLSYQDTVFSYVPIRTNVPKLFVTIETHDGNLMGDPLLPGTNAVEKADRACNASVAKPDGQTYRALFTDGVNRTAVPAKDWVLRPLTTYFRPDGVINVFTTTADALTGSRPHHSLVENADRVPATWTGFADESAVGSTCDGWTSAAALGQGGTFNNGLSYGSVAYCERRDVSFLCVSDGVPSNTPSADGGADGGGAPNASELVLQGTWIGNAVGGAPDGGVWPMLPTGARPPLGPNGPAVASDGTNFLVIQATNKDYYDGGIQAVVVDANGKAVTSAPLFHGMTAPYVPGIAFGAGHYLVVYAEVNQKTLWGLFVSTAGAVEGAPFVVSQSNYPPPAVAFGAGVFVVARASADAVIVNVVDPNGQVLSETKPYLSKNEALRAGISSDGTNFLIAWAVREPDPNTNATNATHVTAGRVNAQGAALDAAVIPVSAETGIDESFAAAFQGGQHFVSWFHRPNSSSLSSGTVRVARIGLDGSPLDGVPNPAGGHAVSFSKTPKDYPRLARFGSQLLVVWLLNDVANFDRRIAGTRVGLDGLPLDSSPTDEGLWLSPQRDYTDLPALAFAKDRALVAFALVSGTTWSLKDTLVFPW
jgi:hypothetical protein